MHLNHPVTIPPTPVHGKIVFHETDPWCQKGWRLLFYSNCFKSLSASFNIWGISGLIFADCLLSQK